MNKRTFVQLLANGNFSGLFITEMGWNRPHGQSELPTASTMPSQSTPRRLPRTSTQASARNTRPLHHPSMASVPTRTGTGTLRSCSTASCSAISSRKRASLTATRTTSQTSCDVRPRRSFYLDFLIPLFHDGLNSPRHTPGWEQPDCFKGCDTLSDASHPTLTATVITRLNKSNGANTTIPHKKRESALQKA